MITLSLSKKLILAFVFMGAVPLAVVGWRVSSASNKAVNIQSESTQDSYQTLASSIMDKIERNLFERYGDVQAFGVNGVVHDKTSWYQVGSEKNKIADAANQYAALYGFYLISMFVDLDGKVISVNDKDPKGKAIETAWLYQKNFKSAPWFQKVMEGKFLKSDILDGTYVEDVYLDEDVKKAYGSDTLIVGFAAPVKDTQGKVMGVWHNCAAFSLVEEIVSSAYLDLKKQGLTSAQLTLVDHTGRVLIEHDPSAAGKEEVVHDYGVLLKTNLADAGLPAAKDIAQGKSGHGEIENPATKSVDECGYAVSQGALGYAGLKWGLIVRIDKVEASRSTAPVVAIKKELMWVAGFSILGLALIAGWIGHLISTPIRRLGQTLDHSSQEIASASQNLAAGAGEQAASMEESSASLEEMTSMVKRNSEHAQTAREVANQTRTAADAGSGDMKEMTAAMDAIKVSSNEISKIIKTIDEIAFQTNILALNAAVEAARAGEAGMGFAVVADEVRNLAHRSAEAARETTRKIDDSIKKSDRGVELSTKVAEGLNNIVAKARQVDELVAEIALATKEQSQGIEQTTIAVSQIDKVTQSNAAGAEELSANVMEMKSAIIALTTLIDGKEGAPGSGNHPAPKHSNHSTPGPKASSKKADHPIPLPSPSPRQLHTQPAKAEAANGSLEKDFRDF